SRRGGRRAQAAREWPRCLSSDEGAAEPLIEVVRCAESGEYELARCVALSGSDDVVSGEGPAAQNMSDDAMLFFEERQLFSEENGELVGNVQSRESIFSSLIERILRKRDGLTTRACAEDFADVVQGLAVGVGSPHGQLLEHVVGAELGLYRV